MEIAAGCGNFSWMIPFAMDGEFTLYLNDIGKLALQACMKALSNIYTELGTLDILNNIKTILGDCRILTSSHHELIAAIDCICAFNVQLYHSLDALLIPGGKAFLCAGSFVFRRDDPLYKFYQLQKKNGAIYPGFATFDATTYYYVADSGVFGMPIFENVKQLQNDEDGNATHLQPSQGPRFVEILSPKGAKVQYYVRSIEHAEAQQYVRQLDIKLQPSQYVLMHSLNNEQWLCKEIKIRTIYNYFSPAIYRNAVSNSNTSLTVEDAFFIDQQGNPHREWIEAVTDHVGAILLKRQITID